MEELYHKLERMLQQIVTNFFTRYGGDREELLAEANLAFVRAMRRYDPKRGAKPITWVHIKVWRHLQNVASEQRNRRLHECSLDVLKYENSEGTPDGEVRAPEKFELQHFQAELSEPAKRLVNVLTRRGVIARIVSRHTGPGRRAALADVLIDMGWSAREILEGMQNVARNL